jgi:preprotein translocase subunit SecA
VQLIGGMVLHHGMIAEMKTGEGKTLVATLPVYLNALSGKGVHVVTVNDYLAKRDAEWMGKIYKFLGMEVGCIIHGLNDEERASAYACDITYGTNNEFGFDYLRDNMRYALEHMVQRPFNFAIVDEVDSILIDEARTPLIISGPTEDNSELYYRVNSLIPKLISGTDYEKDEKARSSILTEDGTEKIEQLLRSAKLLEDGSTLYDISSIHLVHHVNQALRAHSLFQRDVDYIVHDGKLVIIDEFTGRMMEGRRYSEGLHQALEAKENVQIQNENQTLASITFQNYFRLYKKLAGMTGTAMTEASEFFDIYGLNVVEVPPHLIIARVDEDDEIYLDEKQKQNAFITAIEEAQARKQPVLVGTVSIEKSEQYSALLKEKKLPHQVLNARHHEKEAVIIEQAGRPGAITIATNMAGRGTDIMLGGNPIVALEEALLEKGEHALLEPREELEKKIREQIAADKKTVLEAGGLFVLGTERHESRRIDNQLRGRSGRQGDPGKTKFYLSLEDDLMRIFGSERMGTLLPKMGMKEGEALIHPFISKAIERAQKKVEERNYDIRKNLLKFDDVMNDQRKVIYEQRRELMASAEISETIIAMREEVNESLVASHVPDNSYAEQWDVEGLSHRLLELYGLHLPIVDWAKEEGVEEKIILARIQEATQKYFAQKEEQHGEEIVRIAERRVLLMTLDQLWKEHLLMLDHLRQGINLRAYAQKDPLNEYKREAFLLFQQLLERLREVVIKRLAHLEIGNDPNSRQNLNSIPNISAVKMQETRSDPALMEEKTAVLAQNKRYVAAENRDAKNQETWGKVARNEPCPCGSEKKYKHCHGSL